MTTTRREDINKQLPHFELRCGGLHLTVQRIPGWLVVLITTAGGAAGTWWAQR
ncbi:hypothetical protein Q5762_25850 [Streptomyces sp. P9(2023)]|uniref:hypothetical protein n=1 Tax=Streptomyces sp. P9(2023) TaxID=3064394 RepID=UPI0028F435F9|nr:hypothetical protein [Streptomyces sp. P9(2023)]MDT9691705.1 hypothetical protein [Streptomyces sp. P9(2023)]